MRRAWAWIREPLGIILGGLADLLVAVVFFALMVLVAVAVQTWR